ncbi:MAG: hypothetical protein FJY81_06345 [Candidatus Aminicenantes bacterium]|nr:hypothetical protein [Candidatus Aminicenantes bacterium]
MKRLFPALALLTLPALSLLRAVTTSKPALLAAGTTEVGAIEVERTKKYLETLKIIHDEVRELGAYPGENFIRGEFFIGSEDDDDTYKDIHVSILIQQQDIGEKMKVQVTSMEPGQGDRRVKYARSSKNLVCLIRGKNIELESSDFKEKDLAGLAEKVVRAVKAKKKLLSLSGSGRRGSPDWPAPRG